PPPQRPHHQRPHPVRRRREPGELRRSAPQHEGSGDRNRDRPRQSIRHRGLRRHRLRRADRGRRPCRRSTGPVSPPARRTRSARPPETSLEEVLYQVKRVIVGQDVLLERMLIVLLAKGHLLVEGVPGLAKTLAVKTLAGAIGCEFQRVQFTPDLVPADIVGTRIYNQKMGEFQVALGPIFANLVLADEINRAPAKEQSALLEAMQERQAT